MGECGGVQPGFGASRLELGQTGPEQPQSHRAVGCTYSGPQHCTVLSAVERQVLSGITHSDMTLCVQ
jgi:hypothetical protein